MSISFVMPNQRNRDPLDAIVGHTFKMALYPQAAALDNTFDAYSATGECPNSGNYTTGGKTLAGNAVASGSNKSWLDFTDPVWTALTQAAIGFAVIYDSTSAGKEVWGIINFGTDLVTVAEDFTVVLPAADASNAIIRIANANP